MDNIRMAYLLLGHKNPRQINMFIEQLIDYGDCDIYVHVDKKAESIIPEIKKNEHVFVVSKYSVSWGSFEIPKAALELMKMAVNSGNYYTHFYFGSCQDLLIKKGMYDFLEKNPSSVFLRINGPINNHSRASARYRVSWPKKLMIRNDWHPYRFIRICIQLLCRVGIVYKKNKIKLSDDITFYEGRTWFIAPTNVIEYIIEYINKHPIFLKFWEESLASDLMFFQTIIMNSPYKKNVKDELMYVNFGKTFGTMNHPLTITNEDLEKIREGNWYCARKFELYESQFSEQAIKQILKETIG